jgi:hypothetical protein
VQQTNLAAERLRISRRSKTVTGTEWILAGLYMAALVAGSLSMSAFARRRLARLKQQEH